MKKTTYHCKSLKYIDEWSGWVWVCVQCGKKGREATDKECKEEGIF